MSWDNSTKGDLIEELRAASRLYGERFATRATSELLGEAADEIEKLDRLVARLEVGSSEGKWSLDHADTRDRAMARYRRRKPDDQSAT